MSGSSLSLFALDEQGSLLDLDEAYLDLVVGGVESPSLRSNPCPVLLAIDQRAGTNLAEIWQGCEGYSPIIV